MRFTESKFLQTSQEDPENLQRVSEVLQGYFRGFQIVTGALQGSESVPGDPGVSGSFRLF